jgi:cholestenol Delta-isomerase
MSRRDLPIAVQNKKSLPLSCRQVTGVGGFADSTEMLYFDFFRSKTAPGTNQFVGSDFWQKLVLQLSHEEPAVKHAVLAISAVHQQWDMYGSSSYDVDSNAFVQYGKAVADAKTMLRRTQAGSNARKGDIEKVLVACILFVCFENLVGDFERASLHLANGLQILESEGMQLSARGLHHNLDQDIVELLNQFDFQAMTFSQAQFPMRKAADRFSSIRLNRLPDRFESLSEVRIYLFEHINWALAIDEVLVMSRMGQRQHPVKDPPEMLIEATIEHVKINATLGQFWELVEEFVDRSCIPTDPMFRSSPSYLYLLTYFRVIHMLTEAGSTGHETSWDACIPEMVVAIEELKYLHKHTKAVGINDKAPLSLEVGICVPLYVIGNKCRDPILRRRVVDILESDQRKEGIWESFGTARVVERSILVEERKARQIRAKATGEDPASIEITCAADVPEEARVRICWTHVDMAKRTVLLKFAFRAGDWLDGEWSSMEEEVEF